MYYTTKLQWFDNDRYLEPNWLYIVMHLLYLNVYWPRLHEHRSCYKCFLLSIWCFQCRRSTVVFPEMRLYIRWTHSSSLIIWIMNMCFEATIIWTFVFFNCWLWNKHFMQFFSVRLFYNKIQLICVTLKQR